MKMIHLIPVKYRSYICQFKKINPAAGYNNGLRTIQTIKLLREATQCGLKQAKNVVDGKLALIRGADVLDFIDLHCEDTSKYIGAPKLGFEYTVVFSPVRGNPVPTGYCFVVHREA